MQQRHGKLEETQPDADSFVLYRILGNDLPPRHSASQTLDNLRFILDHEISPPNLEKRWVINRIVDVELERKIVGFLKDKRQRILRIGFDFDEYRKIQPDYSQLPDQYLSDLLGDRITDENVKLIIADHSLHAKNQYIMNVNGARNLALREGRSIARWVMPWDGNCFLTADAWQEIFRLSGQNPDVKYLIVPMERVLRNADLLESGFEPAALEEPQIIFRHDSRENFDEALRYGHFSKVELLRRLGVNGVWDSWSYQPWDNREWTSSPESGRWTRAGWVARLCSGERELDADPSLAGIRRRAVARRAGIMKLLGNLDMQTIKVSMDRRQLFFYDDRKLRRMREDERSQGVELAGMADAVRRFADSTIAALLPTIADKKSIIPSGGPHDHLSKNFSYTRKDGAQVPEAGMFLRESERPGGPGLRSVFDNITALALAWYCAESVNYARRAMEIVRTRFIAPDSRANLQTPCADHGISETGGLYYFLDGLRLLKHSPEYSSADDAAIVSWCAEYLWWLLNSEEGSSAAHASSYQGTCYDLQVLALAAFIGDVPALAETGNRARARLSSQFAIDGSQPLEMARADALHHCMFNLQTWFNLGVMAENVGIDLWTYPNRSDAVLMKGLRWLSEQWISLRHRHGCRADELRWRPLISIGSQRLGLDLPPLVSERRELPLSLHPHAGIPPFWFLV